MSLCNSTKLTSNVINDTFSTYIKSLVETKKGVSCVKIKDVFKKNEKEVSVMNELLFNTKIPDLKIGKLEPNAVFYIIEEKTDSHARKIKLPDETEAILLSRLDAYSVVETKLEEFVSTVSKILFIAIIIIGTGFILAQTGWFIFIGILMIPLAFIIILFFSLPLYFFLGQIIKRF